MRASLVASPAAAEGAGGRGEGGGGLEEAAGPPAGCGSVLSSSSTSRSFLLLLPSLRYWKNPFAYRWRSGAHSLPGGGSAGLQVSGQEQEAKTSHDGGQTPF